MTVLHRPDPVQRDRIENAVHTGSSRCWTCGSCDFECPVNVATGRLRPQKLVRMANLGYLEELLGMPDIWYCLTCRRCYQICPNAVKPSALIEYLRRETVVRGLVSLDTLQDYKRLFSRFQRIRWHAIADSLAGSSPGPDIDSYWCKGLEMPISEPLRLIAVKSLSNGSAAFRKAVAVSRTTACFTCGECSSACPVSGERSVFDPRTVIRRAGLGLMKELFESPDIWLCIACGRCTEACSQLVDGRRIIAELRTLAVDSGVVDRGFPQRLERINKIIYARLLDEIDVLFGWAAAAFDDTGCTERVLRAAVR